MGRPTLSILICSNDEDVTIKRTVREGFGPFAGNDRFLLKKIVVDDRGGDNEGEQLSA